MPKSQLPTSQEAASGDKWAAPTNRKAAFRGQGSGKQEAHRTVPGMKELGKGERRKQRWTGCSWVG